MARYSERVRKRLICHPHPFNGYNSGYYERMVRSMEVSYWNKNLGTTYGARYSELVRKKFLRRVFPDNYRNAISDGQVWRHRGDEVADWMVDREERELGVQFQECEYQECEVHGCPGDCVRHVVCGWKWIVAEW